MKLKVIHDYVLYYIYYEMIRQQGVTVVALFLCINENIQCKL